MTLTGGLYIRQLMSEDSGSSTASGSQGVVGGYLTLLPQGTGLYGYGAPWAGPTGWDVETPMDSSGDVTPYFSLSGEQGPNPDGAWVFGSGAFMSGTNWGTPTNFTVQFDVAAPTGLSGLGDFSLTSAPGVLIGGTSGMEFLSFFNEGIAAWHSQRVFPLSFPATIRLVGAEEKLYILSPYVNYELSWQSGSAQLQFGDFSGGGSGLTIDNLKYAYNQDPYHYPTGAFTWTTEAWLPRADGYAIGGGLGYRYYDHGSTTATFQKSSGTGWVDVTGLALTGGYFASVQLTGVTTGEYVRLQITQSGSGSVPPEVSYFELYANSNPHFVEFSPNFWPDGHIQRVLGTVQASKFRAEADLVDQYDEVYIYTDNNTGVLTGIIDHSEHRRTITQHGSGEYTYALPRQRGFKNYIFGEEYASNPWLEPPFYTVNTVGATGQLPTGFLEPSNHYGSFLTYEMVEAYKTEQIAEAKQSGNIYGTTPDITGHILRVSVTGGDNHKGHGIELAVDSPAGYLTLDFLARPLSGENLRVWVTGDWAGYIGDSVPGFTGFQNIRRTFWAGSGTKYIGLGVYSAATGGFELAQASIKETYYGYTEVEAYSGALFQTGYSGTSFPNRAGTVLGGIFSIHSIAQISPTYIIAKGSTYIEANREQELIAHFSTIQDAWGTTVTGGPYTLTGHFNYDVPHHIALVHQLNCWRDRDAVGTSGSDDHFAKTDKVYLTVDGIIHDQLDLCTDWETYGAPYIGYLAEASGTLAIMSGVLGEFDAIRHRRAPSVSLEASLAKDSRVIAPRGIKSICPAPGTFRTPTTVAGESPYNSVNIWNFGEDDGPAGFDKGWAWNHAMLFGDYVQHTHEAIPYTYFPDGSYAKAPHDSALDKMLDFGTGVIIAGRFRGTGTVLEISGQLKLHSDGSTLYAEYGSTTLSGAMEDGWNAFNFGSLRTGVLYVNTGQYDIGPAASIAYSGTDAVYLGGPSGDMSLSYVSISVPTGYYWVVQTATLLPTGVLADPYGCSWVTGFNSVAWWGSNYHAYFDMSGLSTGSHDIALAFMGYDDEEFPGVMGFRFYPEQPSTIYMELDYTYPSSGVGALGSEPSVFRLYYNLPAGTVGIARYEVPELMLSESLGLVDLSDELAENIAATIPQSTLISDGYQLPPAIVGSTDSFDIFFEDKLASDSYYVTSVANLDFDIERPVAHYYIYPLGDEHTFLYMAGAYTHNSMTGDYSAYRENIRLARSLIKLTTYDGLAVDKNTFPWDVWLSPYYEMPSGSVFSTAETGKLLPNGMFSAYIVSDKPAIPDKTILISYPAKTWTGLQFVPAKKEIYKPVRIMGDVTYPTSGMYTIQKITANQIYDLRIYGVNNDYSGKF